MDIRMAAKRALKTEYFSRMANFKQINNSSITARIGGRAMHARRRLVWRDMSIRITSAAFKWVRVWKLSGIDVGIAAAKTVTHG
jgi:hypothetical protein